MILHKPDARDKAVLDAVDIIIEHLSCKFCDIDNKCEGTMSECRAYTTLALVSKPDKLKSHLKLSIDGGNNG